MVVPLLTTAWAKLKEAEPVLEGEIEDEAAVLMGIVDPSEANLAWKDFEWVEGFRMEGGA